MKKKFGMRMLHGLAAVVLAAGLLSTGALAADCKHSEITKGYCEDCKTQFAALVGTTHYENIKDAVKAAGKQNDKKVVLLSDLQNQSLKLGNVYLAVDGEAVTIEKCTLTAEAPAQVILNEGELTLKNTTVTNEAGDYALLNRGGTTELSTVTMEAETAQVRVEGGMLELATAPVDRFIVLECELPGTFAAAVGSAKEKAEVSWIGNASGRPIFDSGDCTWRMSGNIASAVTLEEDEVVYSGEEQYPPIKVVLHSRELVEGEDYTVVCPAPETDDEDAPAVIEPVTVGTYALRIEGAGDYSGSFETEFAVIPAEPAVKWSADSDTVTYTGSAAALNAKAEVKTVDGSEYTGEVTYTYRTAGTEDAFVSGLPVHAGKYEIKAAVAAFDNHTAAETEAALVLTIEPKTVTPVVEVPAVADGYHYTGAAHSPVPVVKDGDTVIDSKEYTVSYANNTAVGTASVAVSDNSGGNYTIQQAAGSFAIGKAAQTALKITGAPASVAYGDTAIQLGVSGGSTDAAVTWEVTEGKGNASVDSSGSVNIIGVGKFTVQATKAGDANYEPVTAQWTMESSPAVLTVSSVEAADKVFDGTNTVAITNVVLSGVRNNEDVTVRLDELMGELADAKAGAYTEVKLKDVKLNGATAKYYTLTQPEGGVPTNVKITKAALTTALESIEVSLPIDSENVVVENLGGAMPKDAGALTFTNRIQTTGEGTQAIVLNWGVDAQGKLTAQVVNGKGGDKVTFEVAVASENYETTVVKVLVSMGAMPVDTAKLTVTLAESELVYNGQAQKPALTVKYEDKTLTEGTDYELKYPDDVTSAGEKEVTVTFKGSYEGTAAAKYTVAKAKLTVSGTKVADKTYNGNTTATVTVGTVSGVVQGDDVKVTATGVFADKNSGSRSVTVTYKLEGKAAGNYVLAAETEAVNGKITAVTATQLNAGISGITTANATSANRYALQNVINQANTALSDTGLSTAEKTNISNVKWNAENIIARIDTAAAAANTESIRATAEVTAENVTVENKAALEKTKSDLTGALNNYSSNYTAAEEQTIKNSQTRVDSALTVITRVESAQTLIEALPDDLDNVDAATSDSIKDAQSSYDALSEYEKSLLSEQAKLKLTAAGLADQVSDPENSPTQNITGTTPDPDADAQDEDTIQLPMWIFWLAVLVAALIALGFVWIKIKQKSKATK